MAALVSALDAHTPKQVGENMNLEFGWSNDFREKILELCRFYSCKNSDYISLSQYVTDMKDQQEEIYYLSSETVEQAEISPHIEGFKARDIDVIVLSDPIDEFWLPLVSEFEGKKFKSASRGALDLDKFEPEKSEKSE